MVTTRRIWTGLVCAISLSAVLVGCSSANAAAGLSVTPPIITNDLVGSITVLITGLSAGKTVTLEKWTDFNGNGSIDIGQDYMLQSFTVTDGQLPIINSVRNLNVPGDDDGLANGQIRVGLYYPGVDTGINGAPGKLI